MKPANLVLTIFPLVANAYKGDMTHYTPGLGSCGHYTDPSKNEPVVALSREIMNNGPNPNNNPKCGTKINIYNPGTKKTHHATIVDTCWACKKEDIDVNEKLFNAVAPHGDGRVHGIQWSEKAVRKSLDAENVHVVGGEEWQKDVDPLLVKQGKLGGSMRFREVESFAQGCGRVVGKIWETSWRFWEY
ncbi:MAG: hypothetical protein L6R41_006280 [Letrouitia leprolyta]|nr:MAG: hypothetical protein L6R41_006280 [Letrouitia leprolyta]